MINFFRNLFKPKPVPLPNDYPDLTVSQWFRLKAKMNGSTFNRIRLCLGGDVDPGIFLTAYIKQDPQFAETVEKMYPGLGKRDAR